MSTPHRAAVLGSPIAHSLSPALHNAGYAALGLDGWQYGRHEVDESTLAAFVTALDPAEWAGLSLTMPLKRAIRPLLDTVSDTARAVDAVNTVVLDRDGRRHGDNTDVPGLVNALRERGVERVESAAVLGAGATASSALAALAQVCDGEVTAYVRSAGRAAEMRALGERLGVPVRTADWADGARALDGPLTVSTTPVGATDGFAAQLTAAPGVLFDVLYHPWPTALAAACLERGGTVLGGLDLLVHQAVLQFERFTGVERGPLAAMRAAGEAALAG
ncbi:shikimate dehydrogenase [Kitasatospora sp. YST-16]|uniref:shikimate dehydrogenase n=1 Tax=unclassified Kitasatospora TaxID=2633591 RepID=UPI0004C40F75|nr:MULTISPECIES: shikimate dehydrogenase [unclassified Kitasatospora]WAL70778.1 shikimate dehydrogenase [Kitasatospora sp. YST-16]WNW36816.1 shikimate dehydrogenase [Streptomyces sp. Li-HN-5-13]